MALVDYYLVGTHAYIFDEDLEKGKQSKFYKIYCRYGETYDWFITGLVVAPTSSGIFLLNEEQYLLCLLRSKSF